MALGLPIEADRLYDGRTLETTSAQEAASRIEPGTIVILSEIHNLESHHQKQIEFLRVLAATHERVSISVGMEFFEYPHQGFVDGLLAGRLSEDQFLDAIGWRGNQRNDFRFYRSQVWFPTQAGGTTVALNAPRSLAHQVATSGLDSLSADQAALLPPQFERGNERYRERFTELMRDGHVGEDQIPNYFDAQSIWDDTMAWNAADHLSRNPDQILVILVGDFHAIYGGGLPDRIRARGYDKLITISQVNLEGLSDEEQFAEVSADPRWGLRADYVWTSAERAKKEAVFFTPEQNM